MQNAISGVMTQSSTLRLELLCTTTVPHVAVLAAAGAAGHGVSHLLIACNVLLVYHTECLQVLTGKQA